jgi:hypothetical protein
MYEEISVIDILPPNAVAYFLKCEDFFVLITLAIAFDINKFVSTISVNLMKLVAHHP